MLKPVLLEKAKAEEALRGSGMEFVIVRPGGLTNDAATGTGALTESTTVCGPITREDVASLVSRCVFSDKAANKTLSAIDSDKASDAFDSFAV